ncbi:hypothetical protein RSAG8_05818, partial [Rhizoctonia solani AG-8 WAC10335]
MLENAKIYDMDDTYNIVGVEYPDDGIGADDLGFNVTYDLAWTFTSPDIDWTYVIDLDNLAFTINGIVHLRLNDNMPPQLVGYNYHEDGDLLIPREYLCAKVNLWPAPNFDTEEYQQKYEALQPIIVPATEWGAPAWDELSMSQRVSIEITHHLCAKVNLWPAPNFDTEEYQQKYEALQPIIVPATEWGAPAWDELSILLEESVGIILSSQQELVVVAVDGPKIRHSPILDIRTTDRGERPGRATDGRLLLTYLLSPPLTVSPLSWRTRPHRSPPVSSNSITKLPPEVLQMVVHSVDMRTYLALCRVSKSIRSVCVANPRIGRYTVLYRIPGFETIFAARSTDGALETIELQFINLGPGSKWRLRKIWPAEFEELMREKNTPCTDM